MDGLLMEGTSLASFGNDVVGGDAPVVLLGMSGGTDSSVAAMLLLEQGVRVEGITFRFTEGEAALRSIDEAAALAMRLGIRHHVMDLRERFGELVIDYFVDEYMAGRTPVPCVVCNKLLKWPQLLEAADRLGIERVATGHYARLVACGREMAPFVARGVDEDKDQSFFLWTLPPEVRRRMVLPLGAMTKTEVRTYAAAHGFERVATKKDSLGVCFSEGDYRDFLRTQIDGVDIAAGRFVSSDGLYLGMHDGYPFFTVGQRRGFGVTTPEMQRYRYAHGTPERTSAPLFVSQIRPSTNEVVLSPLSELYQTTILLEQATLWDDRYLLADAVVMCQIRYRKQLTPCRIIRLTSDTLRLELLEPLEMIAPGQAAALYDGVNVIGGGIILG